MLQQSSARLKSSKVNIEIVKGGRFSCAIRDLADEKEEKENYLSYTQSSPRGEKATKISKLRKLHNWTLRK